VKQLEYEDKINKSWAYFEGGATAMQKEIVERLKSVGWKEMIHAFDATIRIWVVDAYLRSGLIKMANPDYVTAHQQYSRAVDLIEWAQRKWPINGFNHYPSPFLSEKYTLRGIKRLKLASMFNLPDRDMLAELECAISLLRDVENDPPMPGFSMFQPIHYIAYWMKPKSAALSKIGMIMLMQSKATIRTSPELSNVQMILGARKLIQAAEALPKDDRLYIQHLRAALDSLLDAQAPLKETLPVVEQIRAALPGMLKIWAGWGIISHYPALDALLKASEERITKAMKEGQLTMDSVVDMPRTLTFKG